LGKLVEIEEIKQVISTMTILTMKVINFVKLHYVLKDLFVKEKKVVPFSA